MRLKARSRGARALPALSLLVGLAGLLSACASGPGVSAVPISDAEARSPREAVERARAAAYRPRRFKALLQGEMAQSVGAIVRGYLSCWWDGRVLVWRTSAPLAGAGDSGRLTLDGSIQGPVPFPGGLGGRDAIGVLLGVLDLPPAGDVTRIPSGYRVPFGESGRAALLDEKLHIVGLELPGARVRYEPGEAFPRAIDARSRDGTAKLALQSFGDWPETEPLP